MSDLTLDLYKAEERRMTVAEARRGLWFHGAAVIVVSVALALVNVFVAPEFPWAVFPFVGMSIGFFCHWYFGVHRGAELMQRHQDKIEREAEHRLAA